MNRMRPILWSLALLVLGGAPSEAEPPPTLQDDAYHFPQFRDGQNDLLFVEWWYFNLVDAESDLRLVVSYAIFNPDNIFGVGRAVMIAAAYLPDRSFSVTNDFPAGAFAASSAQADVSLGPGNRIEVLGPDVYRVVGSISGTHDLAWDLVFSRRADPWFGSRDEQVGGTSWQRMNWLVYMPRADVDGSVVVDGETFLVDEARGYHDHNWGEWNPVEVVWSWAQYAERWFNLEIGHFRSQPVGDVAFELWGTRTELTRNQYDLLHTRWAIDPTTFLWVPTTTWLVGSDGRRALILRMDVEETLPFLAPASFPFFLVEPVIFEQTARFAGSVWERNRNGRWALRHLFSGDGFKEYTATRWTGFP